MQLQLMYRHWLTKWYINYALLSKLWLIKIKMNNNNILGLHNNTLSNIYAICKSCETWYSTSFIGTTIQEKLPGMTFEWEHLNLSHTYINYWRKWGISWSRIKFRWKLSTKSAKYLSITRKKITHGIDVSNNRFFLNECSLLILKLSYLL